MLLPITPPLLKAVHLTETETRLLLDEGITPAGKPLLHSLMVLDHYNALLFITLKAKDNIAITPNLYNK